MASCKLLTVLLLLHNTGVSVSIFGGEDAKKDRWPWMVHINISSADGRTRWRCGGTLLNEQWVLTAASCWDKRRQPSERRSMVWVGSYKLRRGAAHFMGIRYAIPHPYFQAVDNGYINDIALINLKKTVKVPKEASPVTLAGTDDIFGLWSECWISGWGHVGNGVPLPDPETLQQLRVSIMVQNKCEIYVESHRQVKTYSEAGGSDACPGDFGGPLVCCDGSGFKQVGIMSYGSPDGCGFPGYPVVYTRVSEYLRFIYDYIN